VKKFLAKWAIVVSIFGASCGAKAQHSTGLIIKKGWSKKVYFAQPPMMLALPTTWDWRTMGLTPVKNQGSCGSCWAFSTVATMQDAMRVKWGVNSIASEQYLLSCNTQGYSCQGGFFAHDMHVNPGGVPQSQYPYLGRKTSCRQGLSHPYKIANWAYIPGGSEQTIPPVSSMKSAISQYGPISAAVYVDQSFQNYRGGIFCGSRGQPNHAITLVGWGNGYWILKNSWGPNWGESGYMRIKFGCNSVGVASSYVMLGDKPGSRLGEEVQETEQ
jgi:C1A family cysteine protease